MRTATVDEVSKTLNVAHVFWIGRHMSDVADRSDVGTILRYRMVFPPNDPESFAAYSAMMAPVFDIGIPHAARTTLFQNQVDSFVLDGIIVSNGQGTPLSFNRTHATIIRGGLDEVIVAYYPQGAHLYVIDGAERRIEPGQIALIDLTRPIKIETGPFSTVTLTISRRLFEQRYTMPHEIHGAVLRDGVISSLLAAHMRTLSDPALTIPQAEAEQLATVTLDFVMSALRLWAGRAADPAQGGVTLHAIRAMIEQQLGNPELNPSRIMQQFGLSRASLYRLFEQRGGVSAYIAERRLRRGFRLVTDTSSTGPRISEIAHRIGFASATVFGRAFRDQFGMTPREARALAWRPIDPTDSPWLLPKITQRFVTPFDPKQTDLVQQLVDGQSSWRKATVR